MSCRQDCQQRRKKTPEDRKEGRAEEAKKAKAEWKADSNSKVNSVRGLECVLVARMTEGTLSIMEHSSFKRTERFTAQSNTGTGGRFGGGSKS